MLATTPAFLLSDLLVRSEARELQCISMFEMSIDSICVMMNTHLAVRSADENWDARKLWFADGGLTRIRRKACRHLSGQNFLHALW